MILVNNKIISEANDLSKHFPSTPPSVPQVISKLQDPFIPQVHMPMHGLAILVSVISGSVFQSSISFINGAFTLLATNLYGDHQKAKAINAKLIEFENTKLNTNSQDIKEATKAHEFLKKIYSAELTYVKTSQKIKALMAFNCLMMIGAYFFARAVIPDRKQETDMTEDEKLRKRVGMPVLDGYETLRHITDVIGLGNLGIFLTATYTLAPWQFFYNRYKVTTNHTKLSQDYKT